MHRFSVLVIDDHSIVRLGLETLIASDERLRLAGSASSLHDGLEAIRRDEPDLVISDIAMGDSSGLDTVRAVVQAQLPRPTLVVSMFDEMLYGEQSLALGASGYVMKEGAHEQILDAAWAVLHGQVWISPALATTLMNKMLHRQRPSTGTPAGAATASLTLREIEILGLMRDGKTTKEIAFALALSPRTVDIHRANMKKKLGLRSGTELIAFALRHA